jgi:hypothetical protein
VARQVKQLTGYLLDEIFFALGFRAAGWQRRSLWPLFWLPAHRFAKIAATFDEIVARAGFQEAARWLLPRFTVGAKACVVENIPRSGPLLIASNHPGAFDALVLTAHIPRQDIKIIVSGSPFLRGLEALKAHFIFIADDPHTRMPCAAPSATCRPGAPCSCSPAGWWIRTQLSTPARPRP